MIEAPVFFCDGMLGRVTRWLRLMGYDAEYAGSHLSDEEILRRLSGTPRILATRDIHLSQRAMRREVRVVRLSGGAVQDELVQLLCQSGTVPEQEHWFSRCTGCNARLVAASPQEVTGRVPADVISFTSEFSRCPACCHVYWPGSHVEHIQDQLGQVVRRLRSERTA